MDNIAYKDYTKKNDIHGTVLYPGVMVAPIQKNILLDIAENDAIESIFDPFHGSGTALYEGLEVSEDIRLVGCDINPLANLITKVKLQGVSSCIEDDINDLISWINNDTTDKIYRFNNSEKWFRDDIARDLTKIRNAIMKVENQNNRLFFWCMMSDVIRKFSNTRTSTYKLHIKLEEKIDCMSNDVLKEFEKSVVRNYKMYNKHSENFELYKCDALMKMTEFEDKEFDITITSPPYGDNSTTVTYGQFSMLSLYWIDKKDLELEGWELDNYSIIDSKSMGAKSKPIDMNEYQELLILPYIKDITEKKVGKVRHFFSDYFEFLDQICRLTGKYIVMTLGNRTVDRITIDLTTITMNYLSSNGFSLVNKMNREIVKKRTPKRTSRVNNEPVNSMSKEYVIIYKR